MEEDGCPRRGAVDSTTIRDYAKKIRELNPRDTVDLIEGELDEDLSEATPWTLSILCMAYIQHQDFAGRGRCRAEMQRRLDSGSRYFCRHAVFGVEEYCRRVGLPLDDWVEYVLDIESNTAFALGDYERAATAREEMTRLRAERLDSANTVADPDRLVSDNRILGMAYAKLGDPAKALFHARELLDLWSEYPSCSSFALESQRQVANSSLSIAKGRCGATSSVRERPSPAKPSEPPPCISVAHVFSQLAQIYLEAGFPEQALRAIDRALSLSRLLGTDKKLDNSLEFVRAKALFRLGRHDEAESVYDRLLAWPPLEIWREIHWYVLFDKGRVLLAKDRLDDAIRFLVRAVAVIEEIRSDINTESGRIGYVGDKQEIYAALIDALLRKKRIEEAFGYVERAKSRALVDLLASQQTFGDTGGGAMAGVRRSPLVVALDTVELATHRRRPADSLIEIGQRRQRAIKVAAKIKQEAPELASLVTVNALRPSEIQALIAEDETLLE